MEARLVELQRQVDTLEQNKLETTTCSQPQQCLRAVEAVEQLVQSIGEELREKQRRCEELASQLEEVSPEQYFCVEACAALASSPCVWLRGTSVAPNTGSDGARAVPR